MLFLAIDTPRRSPKDIIFVNPEERYARELHSSPGPCERAYPGNCQPMHLHAGERDAGLA